MKKVFKSLALIPRGLKYKLLIIFSLMSIIPILTLLYIIYSYIFSATYIVGNLTLVISLSIAIAVLGFVLAGTIITPIIKMARDARGLLSGQSVSEFVVEREDEIGDLGKSLNLLTDHLNKNMNELKTYEQKIRKINMEINKKVLALSTLFQVGNIMSSSEDLDTILQFIVDKAQELLKGEKAFLMLLDLTGNAISVRASHNVKNEDIDKYAAEIKNDVLGKILGQNKPLIVDDAHRAGSDVLKNIMSSCELENIIIVPITMMAKSIGLIASGNNFGNFLYEEDDKELINIFAKQASIAFENDVLLKKTEELNFRDELTGLYNINYLRMKLAEEIQRAVVYQRPCSFVLIEVDDFKNFYSEYGGIVGDGVIKKMAKILEGRVEQVDRVVRFSDEQFAIVCPEKNKMEASEIAENIRKEIEKFDFSYGADRALKRKFTVSVGVSANPLDGVNSEELIAKARQRLEHAKTEGKNRVAV